MRKTVFAISFLALPLLFAGGSAQADEAFISVADTDSAPVGEKIDIPVEVINNSTSTTGAIIGVEIFSASSTRVFQQAFDIGTDTDGHGQRGNSYDFRLNQNQNKWFFGKSWWGGKNLWSDWFDRDWFRKW